MNCDHGVTAIPNRNVDRRVLHLMVEAGGACIHDLGRAWLSADPENSRRLADAFGHIYDRYAAQLQAKDSARSEVAT